MHYARTVYDDDVPESCTHVHIVFWEEEAYTKQEMLSFFDGHTNQLIKQDEFTLHCNILGPKTLEDPSKYKPWPDYDLYLGHAGADQKQQVKHLYHSKQSALGWHRDYLCDWLYDLGKGLVSYGENVPPAEYLFEKYVHDCAVYPATHKKWQNHIPKWVDDNIGNDCLFNIVAESWFEILDVTEKTFNSIFKSRPTVILGAKGVNNYLHEKYALEPLPYLNYDFDNVEYLPDRIDALVRSVNAFDWSKRFDVLNTASNNRDKLLLYTNNLSLPDLFNSDVMLSEQMQSKKIFLQRKLS